ncbi:exonuclease domain-containing protein [Curtobacterium sp. RRHDQ10]|uniref:exonuclease domain-containing protein n=1 Tax=Curtobacterium phyllosphaerae TaxID=3413379 RepID=UPI003BF3BCB1
MTLDFTAIDFETANGSSASACSVGLVKVRAGRVVDRTWWYIRPPFGHDAFLEWNTRIHGIVASDVADAMGWAEQYADIVAFAEGDVLTAHNARFDMGVIAGGCAATDTDLVPHRAMCSLAVARRTYSLDSYRLPVAAMAAGFEDFAHHDAMADAEACAAIIVHAARRHGVDSLEDLGRATRVPFSQVAQREREQQRVPRSRPQDHRSMVFAD